MRNDDKHEEIGTQALPQSQQAITWVDQLLDNTEHL